MKINQRRARQRGGLDGDPQQADVMADGNQRHRGEKKSNEAMKTP
jgi:hypothetical protein